MSSASTKRRQPGCPITGGRPLGEKQTNKKVRLNLPVTHDLSQRHGAIKYGSRVARMRLRIRPIS
ncbi:hypothetical protein GQ53DRAFT_748697 [Thozetella sp. PMI_491]|nr:hypothetical protein GQ53DRAFT_748697 [Thozetella sp. PMI_491]